MLKTKETLLQGPSEDELTCSQKLTKRTLQPHLSNKLQLLHYQIFWQRENSPEQIPLATQMVSTAPNRKLLLRS